MSAGQERSVANGGPEVVVFASVDVADRGNDSHLVRRLDSAIPEGSGIRVAIEPAARSSVLAQRIDPDVQAPGFDGPGEMEPWFYSMFSSPLGPGVTAVVFSLLEDLTSKYSFRHRQLAYPVQPPPDYRTLWSPDAVDWFGRTFEPVAPDDASVVAANIARVIDMVLASGAHLAVCNTGTVFPGDEHLTESGESLRLRANRLALILDQAASEHDLAYVDVDQIVAELGAEDAVLGPGIYSNDARETIAEELSELLLDLPSLSALVGLETMRLLLPRFDRRTEVGVIESWHVGEGAHLASGEPLFDVRFDNLHTRLGGREGGRQRETGRSLRFSVVATAEGYLQEITQPTGSSVPAGSLVGVVSRDGSPHPGDVESARRFPVGLRRHEVPGARMDDE
ncbi:MAG: hypothetical protein OEM39_02950 [Acidimicrobiia bacterium]|nr:hypothetical protein [Acidimicrobiia bacterium]MDH3462124.1 hypothetical protein [Acidimicrobiia bacterium]